MFSLEKKIQVQLKSFAQLWSTGWTARTKNILQVNKLGSLDNVLVGIIVQVPAPSHHTISMSSNQFGQTNGLNGIAQDWQQEATRLVVVSYLIKRLIPQQNQLHRLG